MLPVICVNKIWRTWRSLFDSMRSRPQCCSDCVVYTVLFWPCCPHCLVLTVLSTVVLTVLSTLCCSDRVVHTVLFWPYCPHCVVLTVLSTLCCSDCVVHTVLFWPCCPHCVVLTVLSIQGYKYTYWPETDRNLSWWRSFILCINKKTKIPISHV